MPFMKQNNLKEADKIKISLLKYLYNSAQKDIIIVPEVSVHNSVADMISIDKEIHIYEIKSAKDTFQRLLIQIESYKRCADKITLVIDEKFLDKIPKLDYLENVGIISVNSKYKLKVIKEAVSNKINQQELITYWSPIEIRETLRGFPQWYKYTTEDAKRKLLNTLDDDKLRRLSIFRLKEKYRRESYKRKRALKEKNYKSTVKSRFKELESLRITPLLDVPSSVFIDFIDQ